MCTFSAKKRHVPEELTGQRGVSLPQKGSRPGLGAHRNGSKAANQGRRQDSIRRLGAELTLAAAGSCDGHSKSPTGHVGHLGGLLGPRHRHGLCVAGIVPLPLSVSMRHSDCRAVMTGDINPDWRDSATSSPTASRPGGQFTGRALDRAGERGRGGRGDGEEGPGFRAGPAGSRG